MTSADKWNWIVENVNKNLNAKEEIVQSTWESIFAQLFGYISLMGEVERHRQIQIGSTERIIPDIIINSGGTDLFVVEVKPHSFPFSSSMEVQLFSYLRQLQNSTGILICSKIYVYAYDLRKRGDEQEKIEIEFTKNNPDGARFIELFSKVTFDKDAVRAFVREKLKFAERVERAKEEISAELAYVYLSKHLRSQGYTADEIHQAVSSFDITITPHIPESASPAVRQTSPQTFALQPLKDENKLNKTQVLEICKANGVNIDIWCSLSNRTKFNSFANDIPMRCLSQDWYLLLSDQNKRELYVFMVPANSLTDAGMYVVKNKYKHTVCMRINCGDSTFTDRHSKIKFMKWLVKTINY